MDVETIPLNKIPSDLLKSVPVKHWEKVLVKLENKSHNNICSAILKMDIIGEIEPDTASNMRKILKCVWKITDMWFPNGEMEPRIKWVKSLIAYYERI